MHDKSIYFIATLMGGAGLFRQVPNHPLEGSRIAQSLSQKQRTLKGRVDIVPNERYRFTKGVLMHHLQSSDPDSFTRKSFISWDALCAFTVLAQLGAERLLRFHLSAGYRVEGSLPLRWSAPAFSPFLVGVASLTENRTGSWQNAVSQG